MPLNAVQHYVAGVLNGLTIPGQSSTLPVWVQPPARADLDGPIAFVWGGKMRQRRQSMPRGQAFQELHWVIDIYLSYETTSDTTTDPTVDQEFPLVVDAVMDALRTTAMPVMITDPTTAQQSQMLSIGEEMSLEYPPERAPASMRLVYYTCRIQADVTEVIHR